jgi:hypothetical protein
VPECGADAHPGPPGVDAGMTASWPPTLPRGVCSQITASGSAILASGPVDNG